MSQIKLIIAGIVLAIFAIGGGVIYFMHKSNVALVGTNAVDKSTITEQAASVKNAGVAVQEAASSTVITQAHQDDLSTQTDAAAVTQAGIDTTQKQGVQATIQKYASEPVTPENQTAQAQEISTVRMTGLWQTYCTAAASDAACASYAVK